MIRATTPTHYFSFTTNPDNMAKIVITYAQDDKIILEKHKGDMTFTTETKEGKTYYVGKYTLKESETKKFRSYSPAEIQIRVLMTDNTVLASRISVIDIKRVLNDEVLA